MGTNRQTYIHTYVRNAVTLVWGSPRLAPITGNLCHRVIKIHVQWCQYEVRERKVKHALIATLAAAYFSLLVELHKQSPKLPTN